MFVLLAAAYGWFIHLGNSFPKVEAVEKLWQDGETWVKPILDFAKDEERSAIEGPVSSKSSSRQVTPPVNSPVAVPAAPPSQSPETPAKIATQPKTPERESPWDKKVIRGIYLSRYQVTNNASESTIRQRVRYYKKQGFNTIIHGVWGNGCTMYQSAVMKQRLGFSSCPNLFQDQWLDWLIDEAHKQGMEVHAYFEKGIKLDRNSPIYDRAVSQKWLVPGVDKTYAQIDHYVLDVQVPEVSQFFKAIATEFVQRYPKIDAVQWDDYVGYHAELSVKGDRTQHLTQFMQSMIKEVKTANPAVSFDICHHNPYWSKRYFAADWQNWNIDRAFIQVYNDGNFEDELVYVRQYDGAAIMDNQLHRLKPLIADEKVKGILVFPNSGQPDKAAQRVHDTIAP